MLHVYCCFCDELIEPVGYDPCHLLLGTHWARKPSTNLSEQLLCHAACLRQNLHPRQLVRLIDPEAFPLTAGTDGVLHAWPAPPNDALPYPCWFCGKGREEVKKLIHAHGGIAICNECVELCQDVLDTQGKP
jgi:hypothetical protein